MTAVNWSCEQENIFCWFEKSDSSLPSVDVEGNLVVVARAGCGKTTTIREGVIRAPEKSKWVGAFGKRIERELKVKFLGRALGYGRDAEKAADAELQARYGVKIQTFHSLGCGYVLGRWKGVRIDDSGDRADAITAAVISATVPDDVRRCVTKLHSKAREIAPHATRGDDLTDLAYRFECDPDEQWERQGFNINYVCDAAVRAMDFAATTKPDAIDFADMIFLPVRNGWMRPRFDLVVVDEAQDLTVAQLELALGSLAEGGRACVVGDDRQAIYAFRGADCDSLSRLKVELNAAELGLKTTYRCATTIVAAAARLVPDFVAGPSNPAGAVRHIMMGALLGDVAYGDFILSRANAPLMPTAMALLRAGRRAKVAGRDIGKGLKSLITKLTKGAAANSVPAFIAKVEAWKDRELTRADAIKSETARKSKQDFVCDQHDMLLQLADGAVSVGAVIAAIDALFTDDGLGDAGVVTLSSVHRAKGLEADRVFVLADTLRTGSVEEDNIRYVAITRAKSELIFVTEEK